MIHLQATGQHKNKAGLTHSPVYYPFASTHMVNTQLLLVQNVLTKYRKYFCGFLNSRLLSFARKLMYREYYHVYSNIVLYIKLKTKVTCIKKEKMQWHHKEYFFKIHRYCIAYRLTLCHTQKEVHQYLSTHHWNWTNWSWMF